MHRKLRTLIYVTFTTIVICFVMIFYQENTQSWSHAKRVIQDLCLHFRGTEDMTYSAYQFDVHRSNILPLNRTIPDTRPHGCVDKLYTSKNLPKASVIIPFYNEAWSIMLRCLHSILNRSPSHLLHEVILVDDKSELEFLKMPLDEYLEHLQDPRIKLIRRPRRDGLIVSRMTGAEAAQGDVLIFLDAHNEVNIGWLEPLLEALANNKSQVAIPVIDYIDANLNYKPWVGFMQGGFQWTLDFQWKLVFDAQSPMGRKAQNPFPTATTIGCAIAINKDFFFHLGGFDKHLHIWGGENLELSFKSWMCGGSMYVYPCSRVGHLFRRYLPYTLPSQYGIGGTIQSNLQRIAEVWMDDYKKYYFATINTIIPAHKTDFQSLQIRKALRHKLKCKNFEWYMMTVLSDMPLPKEDPLYYGQLMNLQTNRCLMKRADTFITGDCSPYYLNNTFSMTSNSDIILQNNMCLGFDIVGERVLREYPCSRESQRELWSFDTESSPMVKKLLDIKEHSQKALGRLVYKKRHRPLCLTSVRLYSVGLFPCRETDATQFWFFSYHFKYKSQGEMQLYTHYQYKN